MSKMDWLLSDDTSIEDAPATSCKGNPDRAAHGPWEAYPTADSESAQRCSVCGDIFE